ncbi:hypothetical protein ANTPLA_LOCUS9530 [Anthophora plagiata]
MAVALRDCKYYVTLHITLLRSGPAPKIVLQTKKLQHIIGLAIRLKYVKPPLAAKQILIGQKRKRGRPKLTTRALVID